MFSKALSDIYFNTEVGERIAISEVVFRIKEYVQSDPERGYEVMIGSDSHERAGFAHFVSAITVHRKGNGAIHFWTGTKERAYSLQHRITRETILSVTLAQELRSVIRETIGEDFLWNNRVTFECIHIDVGRFGPTRALIDSMTGMVTGHGFTPVIKPFAFAASTVADRHT